ncbi:MAG: histidine phosphatase family protein [Betaproteobacteria bacterium]|nr:histidine phosphatase family protein [Betaproteobacteria bacterium]
MELILWRHADAGDSVTDPQDDLERRLTDRGRRQAARVARWLQSRLPERCLVLSSPAPRARETADALAHKVLLDERLLPGATGADVLAVAGWPGQDAKEGRHRHVLIVGHQPSLGEAFSLALGAAQVPQRWTVRKGSLVWLVSRSPDLESPVFLRAAIGPDLA